LEASTAPANHPALHLAVLDDEVEITRLLANYLGGHGYRVSQVHSSQQLLELLNSGDPPALVLLDLVLPGEDGLSIARQLREHFHCGLVIITGRGDAVDKVVGLEVGADDYVTKPFDLRELLARVRAVLRRLAPASSGATLPASGARPALHFVGWSLDLAGRRLINPAGTEVPLTTGEFELLGVLARHAGRVLSRDFLLEQTRGREPGPYERTIDVQIGRLRRKLDDHAEEPHIIKSVRGAGYLFVPVVNNA
jgi:DNA-binding response OmpR family regulator